MKKIIIGLFISPLLFLTSASFAEANDRQIESLVFTCYTCHGPEGESPGSIPSLNELSEKEIIEKLIAFRHDQEDPTIMNRIAKGYSEDEIAAIAEYLANLK